MKIKETIGADRHNGVFDEFLSNWLTFVYSPVSIVVRDVCRLFKRHVVDNCYDKSGQMTDFLKEIRRYTGHYACITDGACEDKEPHVLLAHICALNISVVSPLLMFFFEGYVREPLPLTTSPPCCGLRSAASSHVPCATWRRTA